MHLVNAECNGANNSDVLERAFGPVISTRLEDQSEEIKATFKSGLGEQFGGLQSSIVEVNTTLVKLGEDLENKVGDAEDVLKQEMNAKFEDQNVKMTKQFEDHAEKLVKVSEDLVDKIGDGEGVLKQEMNAKFEDQKVNMAKQFENHAEKLVKGLAKGLMKVSEDLVKEVNKIGDVWKQEINAKFEDQNVKMTKQFENLAERFNRFDQFLESKLEEQARSMYEKYTNLLCPNGWVLLDNACIFISNEDASFDSAAKKCSQLASNSRLYEPSTRSHYDLVNNLVESSESISDHSFWIGIRKISSS